MTITKVTRDREQILQQQVFDAEHPGAILHDFGAVLDFVASHDLKTAGKHNLLPIEVIFDLDARLMRPLRLEQVMKRPQLRSHPYLQGLYLVLRASGLGHIEGVGQRSRLRLDPELRRQWDHLNPTEQYFNLLEAWLRLARAEIVGERALSYAEVLLQSLQMWQWLPAKGKRFNLDRPQEAYVPGAYRGYYLLALMDLFGLLKVDHPRRPTQPWCPAAIQHVPFGDALLAVLLDYMNSDGVYRDPDEGADEIEMPRFGAWQPMFQPYFPAWRNNLIVAERPARKGVMLFKVSLGSVWRRIVMPANATLERLVDWILRAFNFDDDHLYEVIYRDRFGRTIRAAHEAMEEGPWAHEIVLGQLPLEPGQGMELMYDFGDQWQFTIELEKTDLPTAKLKSPRIVERHGKAPAQYPRWED
jgi:hypothetical protein